MKITAHLLRPILFVLAVIHIYFPSAHSQSKLTEHTLQLDDPGNMPDVDIEDLKWLSGRWLGEGFGGILEETWNPPMGGAMVASFRLISGGETQFYELCVIEPENQSLVYKVKHFNPGLVGWEEKEKFVSFPLIKVEPNAVYFNGLTLQRQGNRCIHYLAMRQSDGSHQEVKLEYARSTPTSTPESNEIMEKWAWSGEKIPLLLLGSYHMSNPGADQFNLEADDVLADKRQQEIQELVQKLSAFQPTKIAVEAPFGDTATIEKYQKYLKGEITDLRRSEEEQIGFRLAKKLGHQTIYPIDVRLNMEMGGIQELVESDPQLHGPKMAEMQKLGNEAIGQMGEWLRQGTVADMLYEMNRPEFLDLAYGLYFRIFLPIVSGNNYAGADLIAGWYQRNLRIMSNLHQIGLDPGDRILIVFGQGHVPLFERIAEDSPYFEVVDALSYIK